VWLVVVGVLVFLLLAEMMIQWSAIRVVLALIENSPPFRVESLPPDPEAETFSVQTPDGITVRGCLYRHTDGVPRGLIVFCPEFASNHRSAMLYCSALSRAGFHVLAFDFRNHGDSDSMPGYVPLHWLTEYEVMDVNAVLDHVYSRPELSELPLGLFGISRGGGAALYAAAQRSEVVCVATEGAFAIESMMFAHAQRWISVAVPGWLSKLIPDWHIHWTLAISRRVSQFRRKCKYVLLERVLPRLAHKPTLIIAGERDTYVLPEVSQKMVNRIGKPEALWMVEKAKHNLARSVDPVEYDRRLVEFFSQLDRPFNAVSGSSASPGALSLSTRKAR
jgi:pimeloyl-ACP methyl ester carboxylesterase